MKRPRCEAGRRGTAQCPPWGPAHWPLPWGQEDFTGRKTQFGMVRERSLYSGHLDRPGRQVPVENVNCVEKKSNEPACLSFQFLRERLYGLIVSVSD